MMAETDPTPTWCSAMSAAVAAIPCRCTEDECCEPHRLLERLASAPLAATHPAPEGEAGRCASCEHGREHHASDTGECWYSVIRGREGAAIGCACAAWTASVAPQVEDAGQDDEAAAAVAAVRAALARFKVPDELLRGLASSGWRIVRVPSSKGLHVKGEAGLYERLAAIQHDIWSHWMRYLIGSKTFAITSEPTGRGMRTADVEHWRRQAHTPYADLTEAEKASDREQVDRFWHLVGPVDQRDPGAILSAWRTIARLVDHEGFLSPASIADRVAMLVENATTPAPAGPQAEGAGSTAGTTVTLPAATGGVDAFLPDGTESLAPSWQISLLGPDLSVTAWDEGVEIDGALNEDGRVDDIERDALALLAAVRGHREFAARGEGPRDATTPSAPSGAVDEAASEGGS